MENDKSLDQSLNIGSEVTLFEGCVKHVKIGSVKMIREIRQLMKDVKYRFSFCVGRENATIAGDEVDFQGAEDSYRHAFGMVLIEGLTDDEYEQADVKELDMLLDRFL